MTKAEGWTIVAVFAMAALLLWLTVGVWRLGPWQFRRDIDDLRQQVEQLEGTGAK